MQLRWSDAPRGLRPLAWLVLLAAGLAVCGLPTTSARPQGPGGPNGPDPREIPLPAIRTSLPDLPGVKDLPGRPEMPDVLTMNDGKRVTTPEQWRRRREEMKRILEYYAVGRMPPPPGNVRGHVVLAEMVLDGKVRYRLVRLAFGPKRQLGLDIGIFTPSGAGRSPAR